MPKRSILKSRAHLLPHAPGVYFLLSKKGEIFYIGKAKNIHNRIQDHMRCKPSGTINLASKTFRIEWLETENEIEALIKEAEYIKRYQPQNNILLKDDKKYFYIGIVTPKSNAGGQEPLPYIILTHQPFGYAQGKPLAALGHGPGGEAKSYKLEAEYIGPFTEGRALKRLMRYLRKIFPYYTTRAHRDLPCPYCHLKLCPGPSPDAGQYKEDIRIIRRILQGKYRIVGKQLSKDMKEASKKLEFEKAQHLRDTLSALQTIFAHQKFLTEELSSSERLRATRQLRKVMFAQKA